ncbi:MAG: hypothetical protein KKA90_00540 [Nanoarchaeota archaeon]|nr:hypothetical protein [Nanoarchaeota archaeon]
MSGWTYWRLAILLVVLFGAILAVSVKDNPYGGNGVEVAFVDAASPVHGVITAGDIITAVDGIPVSNAADFLAAAETVSTSFTLTVNGVEASFERNESQVLAVSVLDIERTNLEFGLDLRGGTRLILRATDANATADQIAEAITTLETRANLYGLKEISFTSVTDTQGKTFIQIDAAGVGADVVDNLLTRQGNFDAKVVMPVTLSNGSGSFTLGDQEFLVMVTGNDTIRVGEEEITFGETITLADIPFRFLNMTSKEAFLRATVYTGKDIELVKTDPQSSGVVPEADGFRFFFQVLISADGAERFAAVTANLPKQLDFTSGEQYLTFPLELYLDNDLVSSLRISGNLGGQIVNTPQVTGFGESQEEALGEKLNLQTILRSGALPIALEPLSVGVISPTLGANFFKDILIAAGIAALVVIIITFIRYRSVRISFPLAFISFSEVMIVLGLAAKNDALIWGAVLVINLLIVITASIKKQGIDVLSWIGAILIPVFGFISWTIDLPAIAGLIAAIGTGVDHQIIIADEVLYGEQRRLAGLKDKIKIAFFIVFGAALTIIAAMVPLMFIGIGLIRGFAITTIIGVLTGVLIARPAFATIIEGMKPKQKTKPTPKKEEPKETTETKPEETQ